MIYLCTTDDKHIFYNNDMIYCHDFNRNLYGFMEGMIFNSCDIFVYTLPSELKYVKSYGMEDRYIKIMSIVEQKIFENI